MKKILACIGIVWGVGVVLYGLVNLGSAVDAAATNTAYGSGRATGRILAMAFGAGVAFLCARYLMRQRKA